MKFAFLGYHVENGWNAMSPGEQAAMIDECFTYDAQLMDDGHMLADGAALQPTRTAKTLRWKNGAVVVTDGPFAETKEQLGGVGVMEADDMDQAVALMSKHPGLRYGSTFEIRPVDEASMQRKVKALEKLRETAMPVDLNAMKFATLGYINDNNWAAKTPEDFETMMNDCVAFDEGRVKNGEWLHGVGLQDKRTAKTLRFKEGKVIVTDGPFAETKEYLGGIVVLGLKDMNDAVTSMAKHPALPFGVAIEIRPIHEGIEKIWDERQRRAQTV